MTKEELINKVEMNGFWWAENEDGFFVKWPEGPKKEIVKVDLDKLKSLKWPTIKRFLYDGRNVSHMTRVVGYYSKTENWNKSKLGELKDRQDGEYSI
jgi:hypothetical protein